MHLTLYIRLILYILSFFNIHCGVNRWINHFNLIFIIALFHLNMWVDMALLDPSLTVKFTMKFIYFTKTEYMSFFIYIIWINFKNLIRGK